MNNIELKNAFIKEFIHLDIISSTNDFAKEHFPLLKDKTLILADEQTAGRGRFDRNWFSPNKEALYFSMVIKKNIVIEDLPFLNLISSLAVFKSIQDAAAIIPDLKWPNDVYIKKKKVAGVLMETIFKTDRLAGTIIGIGINANIKEFPLSLQSSATSLYLENNQEISIMCILSKFVEHFAHYFRKRKSRTAILEEWLSRSSMVLNKNILITINGIPKRAITKGLNAQGFLLIQTEDNPLTEIFTPDYLLID